MRKQHLTARKKWTIGLSSALVLVLAVGITLALLSTTTTVKINNFQVLGNLNVIIDETYDESEGMAMAPEVPVAKQPWMENNSEGMDVYVAMQMFLVDGYGSSFDVADILNAADYTRLMGMLAIKSVATGAANNYDSGWEIQPGNDDSTNGTIFVYKTKLEPGDKTNNLFNQVELTSNTEADITWIKETLGGFQIVLRGAAVQANGVTYSDAVDELVDMLDIT